MEALRQLGTTDIRISPIVMGMWQAGKEMWAGIDDTETRRAVRAAFDAGINAFDTAEMYGKGHSERMLAAATADIRPQGGLHDQGLFQSPPVRPGDRRLQPVAQKPQDRLHRPLPDPLAVGHLGQPQGPGRGDHARLDRPQVPGEDTGHRRFQLLPRRARGGGPLRPHREPAAALLPALAPGGEGCPALLHGERPDGARLLLHGPGDSRRTLRGRTRASQTATIARATASFSRTSTTGC